MQTLSFKWFVSAAMSSTRILCYWCWCCDMLRDMLLRHWFPVCSWVQFHIDTDAILITRAGKLYPFMVFSEKNKIAITSNVQIHVLEKDSTIPQSVNQSINQLIKSFITLSNCAHKHYQTRIHVCLIKFIFMHVLNSKIVYSHVRDFKT